MLLSEMYTGIAQQCYQVEHIAVELVLFAQLLNDNTAWAVKTKNTRIKYMGEHLLKLGMFDSQYDSDGILPLAFNRRLAEFAADTDYKTKVALNLV